MRSSALAALLFIGLFAPAARAEKLATDAYEVSAPGGAWKRAAELDPPGRLTWNTTDLKQTRGQIRVDFVGAPGATKEQAAARFLDLEKARVRATENQSKTGERTAFAMDSLTVGELKWVGFRVDLKAGERTGAVSRWIAIHPDFPKRHRAFTLALDEETPPGVKATARTPDAMAIMKSLVPRGAGLSGGIETAWLDARAAAFAAYLDTTTKLCWHARAADVSARPQWLGVASRIVLDGDFWQTTDMAPIDSVVDPASAEYGASFDRNGDGKTDLVLMNRGIVPARGPIVLPYAAVIADDNFDGRIDGIVVENGDSDGDGRADHRILARDTNGDGKIDTAIEFVDSINEKAAKKLKVEDGVVLDRITGSTAERIDFIPNWRQTGALREELDHARSDCAR